MDRLRRGIELEETFEEPASAFGIVVAAGLSLVIPSIFEVCPGRGGLGLVTFLGPGADSSREFSGEVRSVIVESARAFLTGGR